MILTRFLVLALIGPPLTQQSFTGEYPDAGRRLPANRQYGMKPWKIHHSIAILDRKAVFSAHNPQ